MIDNPNRNVKSRCKQMEGQKNRWMGGQTQASNDNNLIK